MSSRIKIKLKESCPSSSWIDRFRRCCNDSYFAQNWFWSNFDWGQQSLWIGKFSKTHNLPRDNTQTLDLIKKIIEDIDKYPEIKSSMFIKFYYSKNTRTQEPEINYLVICDQPTLPTVFKLTFAYLLFETYQLTQKILDMDPDFKKMVNHYLCWNNFYAYYELMNEVNC